MSGGGSGGEKSEKATPKKIKKARKDGAIGNSPELGSWVGLLATSFVIPKVASSMMAGAGETLIRIGAIIRQPTAQSAMRTARAAFVAALHTALPMAAMVAIVSICSVAAQGGIRFSPKVLKPKFSRLNPLSGLKRMFGPHGWWQLTKSLLKSVALGVVLYFAVRRLIPTILGSGSLDLGSIVDLCVSSALGLVRFAAAAGIAMSFVDLAVVRKRNNKQLKMTKQEIKDEYKSSEGDPHVRGQRRSMQMAMRRNRMMADVALADVIVVNPTHVAVALRYDPSRGAPRVVAKGADHTARKIRELADMHRVPMVSDIPLARTLYASCDIGQEIPADLYRAVATVLAFIMTLKRRGSAAGVHTVRTGVADPGTATTRRRRRRPSRKIATLASSPAPSGR